MGIHESAAPLDVPEDSRLSFTRTMAVSLIERADELAREKFLPREVYRKTLKNLMEVQSKLAQLSPDAELYGRMSRLARVLEAKQVEKMRWLSSDEEMLRDAKAGR